MPVNFYIDKRTDRRGDAAVRMSVAVRGARFLSSTGLKVPPAKWDAGRQQMRRGCSSGAGMTWSTVNEVLARIAAHFTAYENECVARNTAVTPDMLRAEFVRHFRQPRRAPAPKPEAGPAAAGAAKERPEKTTDLFRTLEAFMAEESRECAWTPATRQKFAALGRHLRDWRPGLTFAALDHAGISAFLGHLQDALAQRNTTVQKQWGYLKWFLRWATARGHNRNTAFQTYRPRLKTVPRTVVYLEWDELMRVLRYEVPPNGTEVRLTDMEGRPYLKTVHDASGIAKTRDIFCFCCLTSLRYSDAAALRRVDIRDGAITLTTVKTSERLTIRLNKYALEVLARHEGADYGPFALPRITNQRMNVYLKDLCELCGISAPVTQTWYRGAERHDDVAPKWRLMGTHAGRRTFICNALMLGIPAEIVMKWTGHSDYKAMRPYIDIADEAKDRAMERFNEI